MENWKTVEGFERYRVSDHGNVSGVRKALLTPRATEDGHLRVVLFSAAPYGQSVQAERLVHHLVLEAFVGPRPPGMEGCHGNGNPADNRLVNLRWDTHSANGFDAVKHGVNRSANKTHCPWRHELVEPNLVVSNLARGKRSCLACDRARRYGCYLATKKGVIWSPDRTKADADARYIQIMEV